MNMIVQPTGFLRFLDSLASFKMHRVLIDAAHSDRCGHNSLGVLTIRWLIVCIAILLHTLDHSERSLASVQVFPQVQQRISADLIDFVEVGGVAVVPQDDGVAFFTAFVQSL